MRKLYLIFTVVCLAAVFLASGCGPKIIPPESLLDTPQNHYSQGLRDLRAGQLDRAAQSFERAISLDPKYPGGYVGMGLVYAEKSMFKDAHQSVDRGISNDKNFIDGHIAKGRVYTMEKRDDNWLRRAERAFDAALKINANSDHAIFYKGIAYKEAFDFLQAANLFSQAIALKGDFAGQADSEWELVQKIQRAAPGTQIGMKIALMPEISRSDLAVLFVEEMKLLEVLKRAQPRTYDTRFRPPEDPSAEKAEHFRLASDIDGHWAQNWIEDVIKAGAMDLFPDGSFHPDEKITRSHYASFVQNILIAVTGDQSLATLYIGTPSSFPDVNNTHYAYNAIRLSVDRGIMKADTIEGTFGMNRHVSGADALLIIREFQNALRMVF